MSVIMNNIVKRDQFQYVSDSTLTPPLAQQQSTDNKVRLMLGKGRGSCAVAQILLLIHQDHGPSYITLFRNFLRGGKNY